MTKAELEQKQRQLEHELHWLKRQIQFQGVADDLEDCFRNEIRITELQELLRAPAEGGGESRPIAPFPLP